MMFRQRLAFGISGLILAMFLAGWESTSAKPPPASKGSPAKSGAAQQQDLAVGQKLFLTRCVKCHAAPKLAKYPAEKWPRIVQKMAKRSALKPDQQQAVLAYVLAARPK